MLKSIPRAIEYQYGIPLYKVNLSPQNVCSTTLRPKGSVVAKGQLAS